MHVKSVYCQNRSLWSF